MKGIIYAYIEPSDVDSKHYLRTWAYSGSELMDLFPTFNKPVLEGQAFLLSLEAGLGGIFIPDELWTELDNEEIISLFRNLSLKLSVEPRASIEVITLG